MSRYPGAEATARLGWWRAHRFLLLRRLCQFGVLGLFLLGPLAGIWILKGNLSSSLLLETVPLTDPLTLLQSVAAGQWPIPTLWLGAGLVLAGYWLVGGGCSAPGSVQSTWSPMPPPGSGGGSGSRAMVSSTALPATGCWPWCWWPGHHRRAGVGAGQSRCRSACGLLFGMGRAGACWRCCSCSTFSWWSGLVRPPLSGGAFYALVNRVGFIKIAAWGASGAATAWIVMRSARSVPSCAAPFTVPGVVTGP